MAVTCTTLEEVRSNIDRLDQQIVSLLAERGHYVSQAARFKKDTDGVKAPQRVEQVISKVRDLSHTIGANPDVPVVVIGPVVVSDSSMSKARTMADGIKMATMLIHGLEMVQNQTGYKLI